MRIGSYLKRIGIKQEHGIKPDPLQLLIELQNKHLLNIPFENLDIPEKKIELDIEKIFEKIIPSARGGFCYELNGLFHSLLTSMGFQTDMLSARVFNQEKNEFGPEFDHVALLVHLNKNYLVDVGFGDSLRIPVEIPDIKNSNSIISAEDISGRYRVSKTGSGIFDLQKYDEQVWQTQYRFSTIPRKLLDFKEMCDYQQDSPDSHFRKGRICTKATPNGRVTLVNNSLTITEGGLKKKINVKSDQQFNDLLKEYFGIAIK